MSTHLAKTSKTPYTWGMVKRLVFAIAILSVGACNRVRENHDPKNIMGVWIGDVQADGVTKRFHFLISSQSGASVSGLWNLAWGEAQGSMTGSVNADGDFNFILDEGANCPGDGTASGNVSRGRMSVRFSGSGCRLQVTDASGILDH